jgi:BASS family bile acid:Na+ symporter
MKIAKQIIERYLLFWLFLLCILAFYESSLPFQPFRGAKSYLKLMFAITMFAVGWMLPRNELQQVLSRWPSVLGGTAIQYAVMPCLAYLMATIFHLEGGLKIGMVMVGCVPGAMASNVLTLTARGNASYSVSLTTTATLVSPLVVPLVMALTLQQEVASDKLFDAASELSWMVALPVSVGHLLSRWIPQSQEIATIIGSIIANLTILWIVAYVVAANRGQLVHLHYTLLLALLGINLCGYLAGNLGGTMMRLPTGMRRALTLEVGMQNAGLGTTLVTSLFPDDPSVAIPPALYTFGCMLTGTILARYWSAQSTTTDVSIT